MQTVTTSGQLHVYLVQLDVYLVDHLSLCLVVCSYHCNMVFFRGTRIKLLRWSWGRTVILLIIMLVSLQMVHITLLSRLEARKSEVRKFQQLKQLEEDTNQLYHTMGEAIMGSQIVDSSGEYKLVNFVLTAQAKPKTKNDVTLVTQCSVNRLHHISELSERWGGPVSVAVFAPREDSVFAMELILRLQHCVPSIRQNVSIHLVFPLTHPPKAIPSSVPEQDYSCDSGTAFYIENMPTGQNYALGDLKYPNNLLRNVAQNNARTDYIFVVDIDMLPNTDLHEHFMEFAITHTLKADSSVLDHKTLFVVPSFEIENNVPIPQDKSTLLDLWNKRLLRPFYYELCWKCQRHTDYETWRNLTISSLQTGYDVGWKDPWEPFFIGPKSIPLYDERFKQYGFNRISQLCELHVGGYKFGVLNNAFLIHRGYKTLESFHMSKEMEQERNRALYRQFKMELKTKYPDTDRRCY